MATTRALIATVLLAACGPSSGDGAPDATPRDGGGSAIDASPPVDAAPLVDVDVVITADNAYSFGYGDIDEVDTYFPGTRAITASQIFNCPIGEGPEQYTVPAASAPLGAYLYVVSWDDLAVTQGVLGQFKRGGAPLYTGDVAWEVCATGVDLSSSSVGPTEAEVEAQIAICNTGTGSDTTTSAGWVDTTGAVTTGAIGTLAIGEANDQVAGGTFPPVCSAASGGIDDAAQWMWFNPGGIANPFASTGSNTFRAYLIFRLAAEDIPIID